MELPDDAAGRESGRDSPSSERTLTIVETPEHVSTADETLPEDALVSPLTVREKTRRKKDKRKRNSPGEGRPKKKKKVKSRKSGIDLMAKIQSASWDEIIAKIKNTKSESHIVGSQSNQAEHVNCNDELSGNKSPEIPESRAFIGDSPCSQEIMRIQNQANMKTIVKQRRISFTTIPISPSKLGENSLHKRTPSPSTSRSLRSTDSPETFIVAQTLLDLSSGSNRSVNSA